MTHEYYEILHQVQGAHHFYRDERLSLQILDWHTLSFGGKPLSEEEDDPLQEKLLIFFIEMGQSANLFGGLLLG